MESKIIIKKRKKMDWYLDLEKKTMEIYAFKWKINNSKKYKNDNEFDGKVVWCGAIFYDHKWTTEWFDDPFIVPFTFDRFCLSIWNIFINTSYICSILLPLFFLASFPTLSLHHNKRKKPIQTLWLNNKLCQ